MDKDVTPKLRKKNERYTIYDMELGGVVQSVTYLNPGQSTLGHSHPNPESYYIASGTGTMRLGEVKRAIEAGSMVYVPSETFHQLINEGDTLLVFVCAFKDEAEMNKSGLMHYFQNDPIRDTNWQSDG